MRNTRQWRVTHGLRVRQRRMRVPGSAKSYVQTDVNLRADEATAAYLCCNPKHPVPQKIFDAQIITLVM